MGSGPTEETLIIKSHLQKGRAGLYRPPFICCLRALKQLSHRCGPGSGFDSSACYLISRTGARGGARGEENLPMFSFASVRTQITASSKRKRCRLVRGTSERVNLDAVGRWGFTTLGVRAGPHRHTLFLSFLAGQHINNRPQGSQTLSECISPNRTPSLLFIFFKASQIRNLRQGVPPSVYCTELPQSGAKCP